MKTIAVIGAGSWGTALSLLLADKGYKVFLWGRDKNHLNQINHERINYKYLPGVKLPDNVYVEVDFQKAVQATEMIVLAVPSQTVREVCKQLNCFIRGNPIIVNTAKGIELKTHYRLSEVIKEEIKSCKPLVSVLSGPSHAEEVGRRQPTAIVAAAEDKGIANLVQDVFMTSYFRVYTNSDLTGVELGGALKNVIALATGIAEGLGFGDNSKAALITRGLHEIARLGNKLGAELLTFAGLSGIGDLVVTCTSKHSRNLRAGIQIGQGKSIDKVLQDMGMVVEGIKTTTAAYELALKNKVDVPITIQLHGILFEGLDPMQGVVNLMGRNPTFEAEEIALNRENW
ncbi:MAG: NAD(P)H-dependent glycerol-3-phosphate dehydrogenase [Bacillota bacterium]